MEGGPEESRRSFIKKGVVITAGAVAAGSVGGGLLKSGMTVAEAVASSASIQGSLSKGDAAILRFLATLETLETDFWQQYNELGGIQDNEIAILGTGSGSKPYTSALQNLDTDMPQYIHDNTDDEFTHFTFIDAFLNSVGAEPVNLDQFRTLPGSQATGAQKNLKRLTNLMELTVDTSWWTRYRSDNMNPDPPFSDTFAQAVPTLNQGQHPAIPRSDADLTPKNHIQAIANTAAFHFAFIEQGGTSVYPSLAQRVTDPVVLRILLSIGPTETMHFQTWSDKAGAAVSPPFNVTSDGLTFPDLSNAGESLKANLIMPEPTVFLSRKFPVCSIIRPTETQGAAQRAVDALTADGLFRGQSEEFFATMGELAQEADAAQRM